MASSPGCGETPNRPINEASTSVSEPAIQQNSTAPVIEMRHEGGIYRVTLNRPQRLNAFTRDLLGALSDVLADIAKEKKLSAVFTEDAVMLSVPEMDMTDEVIKRMNDTVKKIPVDWSAAPAKKK